MALKFRDAGASHHSLDPEAAQNEVHHRFVPSVIPGRIVVESHLRIKQQLIIRILKIEIGRKGSLHARRRTERKARDRRVRQRR